MKDTCGLDLTFVSLHVGVGDKPGARQGKDGGHAELSSTGLARGDLRRRLSFASGGKRVQCNETVVRTGLFTCVWGGLKGALCATR